MQIVLERQKESHCFLVEIVDVIWEARLMQGSYSYAENNFEEANPHIHVNICSKLMNQYSTAKDSTAKVAEIELAEKEKMKEKVDRILKYGINCFINRQLIYNYPEQLFVAAGVMAIEHADFSGIERLALVTGEACTIVLRGATQQILDEAERSLHDALCVLAQTVKETRTVYGGGCSEMLMAQAVAEFAVRTPEKEAVAMESFAKALGMLPTIIADNAGYDSADLVAQLRAAHSEGKTTYGL
ncbi:hypothetical protein scyTo_0005705, partial [Scyliorhinus torazame]|nr:hypothetical protein [Scyliorhinus torazame]